MTNEKRNKLQEAIDHIQEAKEIIDELVSDEEEALVNLSKYIEDIDVISSEIDELKIRMITIKDNI